MLRLYWYTSPVKNERGDKLEIHMYIKLPATTRGWQQRDPNASRLRPRGVQSFSYFAPETQPVGFLILLGTLA